jgi:hypothetical protein
MDGRRSDAVAAVPDALVDAVCLVGPKAAVRERTQAFAEAGVTTLLVKTTDPAVIRTIAEVRAG